MYALMQLHVHADSEWQLHIWFVMCRLSTVTLIVEKYTLTLCYFMCWFFKVTMILSLIKVASHTGTVHACTYRWITMNLSSFCLFFYGKKRKLSAMNIAILSGRLCSFIFLRQLLNKHEHTLISWITWHT